METGVKLLKNCHSREIRDQTFQLFIPIIFIAASSVDIKGVMAWHKIVQLAGCFDDLLNPRITEFDHIARIHIDQVVMLHAMVCFFKLCDILSELMFDHEAAVQQQLDSIVQGGPADPVVLILHKDIERLYIEVAVP